METLNRIVKAISRGGCAERAREFPAQGLRPEHRAATIRDVVALTTELEAAIFRRESERERSIRPT
jgi:hypothetical protein